MTGIGQEYGLRESSPFPFPFANRMIHGASDCYSTTNLADVLVCRSSFSNSDADRRREGVTGEPLHLAAHRCTKHEELPVQVGGGEGHRTQKRNCI